MLGETLASLRLVMQEPSALLPLSLVVGLCFGSFLNVVIARLPRMLDAQWRCDCAELLQVPAPEITPLSLSHPPSACPKCGTSIKVWHNIPLLSYLLLRGRCAQCKTPISLRYPLVELLTAGLSVIAAWHFGFGWPLAGALALLYLLIALTFIDADTQFLPDNLTLPLLWLGLLLNLFSVFVPLQEAVIGAMAGYLSLWSVYWLFKLTTGKEGMGYGDFKLLAALGAWLGWKMLLPIILISSIAGAVIGILLIVTGRQQRGVQIPFGPYLALGGVLALFYGAHINQWLF
ncbi:MAG: prepilin peptidase [Burkholderiaceae bacterium]|nr:MAG: prepilin peptidase [Burkholderiaceae bacterium]